MKNLGILAPVVTPCTLDGEIDAEGLKNVCKDMLEGGCSSIFVAGSTGRGPWFGLEDKVLLCRTVVDYIKKRVPVFAGCMATGLEDMIINAHAMADVGADIAVITAPGYFNYNQSEVERIFLRFADASPLPVLIYDIPVFAGIKLDTDMVIKLSRHGNVIGLKDSSSDLGRFRSLIEVFSGINDFYLIQGKENLLKDSLTAGASGLVVSLLHVNPRPFVALYHAVQSKNENAAGHLQDSITRVFDIVVECLKRRPEISTLFHFHNCCLSKRGICNNIMMDFEGKCPMWIMHKAMEALGILQDAQPYVRAVMKGGLIK